MRMRTTLLIALLLVLLGTVVHGIRDGILSTKPPYVQNVGLVDRVLLPPFSRRAPFASGPFRVTGTMMKVEQYSRDCCGTFVAGVVDGWSTLPSVIAAQALVCITFFIALPWGMNLIEDKYPGASATFATSLTKGILRVRKLCKNVMKILFAPVLIGAELVSSVIPKGIVALIPRPVRDSVSSRFLLLSSWVYGWPLSRRLKRLLDAQSEFPNVNHVPNTIFEEFIFRGLLNWPLWLFGWLQNNYKLYLKRADYNTYLNRYPKMQSNALLFRRVFVLLKGFCFATLDVESHTSKLISVSDIKGLDFISVDVVFKWVSCLIMSVSFLDPVAEKDGVMAAIGARISRLMIRIGLVEIEKMIQED